MQVCGSYQGQPRTLFYRKLDWFLSWPSTVGLEASRLLMTHRAWGLDWLMGYNTSRLYGSLWFGSGKFFLDLQLGPTIHAVSLVHTHTHRVCSSYSHRCVDRCMGGFKRNQTIMSRADALKMPGTYLSSGVPKFSFQSWVIYWATLWLQACFYSLEAEVSSFVYKGDGTKCLVGAHNSLKPLCSL